MRPCLVEDESIQKWESLRNDEDTLFFSSTSESSLCEQANRRDLDRLVMDYFVVEGHKDAAEAFSAESGIVPDMDLPSMEVRIATRDALLQGDVVAAMEITNELNPEVRARPRRKEDPLHAPRRAACRCAEYKPNHHLSTDRRA